MLHDAFVVQAGEQLDFDPDLILDMKSPVRLAAGISDDSAGLVEVVTPAADAAGLLNVEVDSDGDVLLLDSDLESCSSGDEQNPLSPRARQLLDDVYKSAETVRAGVEALPVMSEIKHAFTGSTTPSRENLGSGNQTNISRTTLQRYLDDILQGK